MLEKVAPRISSCPRRPTKCRRQLRFKPSDSECHELRMAKTASVDSSSVWSFRHD